MKLLFLYFSGTGNTDYVARYLAYRLSEAPAEVELCSLEWQPAEALVGYDLLVAGFPVYAVDSPELVHAYLAQLPPGEGRGAFVFCTMGAFAGGAVARNLQRLAARGYVPLGGGSVLMPGTDGLALLPKSSRLARQALEKDYDRLEDADRLAARLATVVAEVTRGRPVEALRRPVPTRPASSLLDRLWAYLYHAGEGYARARLRAGGACRGCGLCARLCPVGDIEMRDGRPHFSGSCALCLRCLHNCPQEAIQIGRLTRDKFRWHGPKGGFQPLRMRPEA